MCGYVRIGLSLYFLEMRFKEGRRQGRQADRTRKRERGRRERGRERVREREMGEGERE